MTPLTATAIPFFLLSAVRICYAQEPIAWHFDATPVTRNETSLLITADLAPGWHLYSQHIAEGGPIPTRFNFQASDDYVPAGIMEEKGKAAVFYNDIYEMEITWYSGKVQFSQRVNLRKPDVTIEGKVEYMVCNDQVCIPAQQEFSIDTSP